MKKIISLFVRSAETDWKAIPRVTPGAEWVTYGQGVPTVKLDGTCCMIRDKKLYKRYTVRPFLEFIPDGFEPTTEKDPFTHKQYGWVPVGDGPEDKWHRMAFALLNYYEKIILDGTYELCGPKVQGNPHNEDIHYLVRHGSIELFNDDVPRDFEGIKRYLSNGNTEGVVWHHKDGRMVKIKSRDFGIPWPKPLEN